MGKYVVIKRIKGLFAIPGATNVKKAVIDGKTYVVRDGQFNPGDEALIIRPGCSIGHSSDYFDFLRRKRKNKETGKIEVIKSSVPRVRKMRIRGVMSHGVAIPMNELAQLRTGEGGALLMPLEKFLGIKKYIGPTTPTDKMIKSVDQQIAQLKKYKKHLMGV